MTTYQQAFIELMTTRDNFYLIAILIVATALYWYRFFTNRYKIPVQIVQVGGLLVVSATWILGAVQLWG